jgi:hypothetical protein
MNKSVSFLTALFFCFLGFVFAQDSRIVAVTAEKEVDIKNHDVAAARTVALSLAARDAVEKAYGTYVKVDELKEARTVLATAAASLKYTILAEEQRGNRYWVKIQANVQVPAEYIQSPEEEREGFGDGMDSFVQKYPQGEINWGDGFVIAFGKGIIKEEGANSEDTAARAAEVDAKAHLLEIINDIPLDDRMKTGQDQRISFQLEGFVKGAQLVARSRAGNVVNVTVQAPIRGVQGLTTKIYGFYTPEPPPPKVEPIKPVVAQQAKVFTGVVIDARKVSITPALFPKVTDTKSREVYSVEQVNKEELQKRGMASYTVVSRDAKISRIFPNATVVQVSYSPQTSANSRELVRRQGQKPFVVLAESSEGNLKSNIMLSDQEAAIVAGIDQGTNALKDCRVVIVVSP